MPGISSLITGGGSFERRPLAKITIVPLDSKMNPIEVLGRDESLTFQYYPETISDKKGVTWSSKEMPGGSHPIYQWISGGERIISFTAVFTQEMSPDNFKNPIASSDKRSVDVMTYINVLRSFLYPIYKDGVAYPPPRLLLIFPQKLKIGTYKAGDILCVEIGCDVEYEDFWEDGTIRKATVSLEFAEIIQGNIPRYISRDNFLKSRGNITYYGK